MSDVIDASPLLRTGFVDDRGWDDLWRKAVAPSPEGFRAELYRVEDAALAGLTTEQLASRDWQDAAVLFIADDEAIADRERLVLCVDLVDDPGRSFRCVPTELWGVENNLRLANMDFAEFAEAVDRSGVFRGFD